MKLRIVTSNHMTTIEFTVEIFKRYRLQSQRNLIHSPMIDEIINGFVEIYEILAIIGVLSSPEVPHTGPWYHHWISD